MIKLPISVCIVSGNEAHRIRPALDSVRDWTSEIIVAIDDQVTDGTDKIAEACGARIIRGPWKGHATHRNLAAANATQPWLLALDADEAVSPGLRDEIIQTISLVQARPDAACAAFSFPRCTFFCERWIRHGNWYPDRVVRLWQRERGRWEGVSHEKLMIEGRTGKLKHDLLHCVAETIDQQIAKISIYSDNFLRDAQARGRKASLSDLVFRPGWSFFRSYFLRLGFLDGWQGCYIAWMTAFYTATRYAKLRAAQSQKSANR